MCISIFAGKIGRTEQVKAVYSEASDEVFVDIWTTQARVIGMCSDPAV